MPLHPVKIKKALLQDGQPKSKNHRSLADLKMIQHLQLVKSCTRSVKEIRPQTNTHMCSATRNINLEEKPSFQQRINKNMIIYMIKDARTSAFPGKVKNLVIIPLFILLPYTPNTHIILLR